MSPSAARLHFRTSCRALLHRAAEPFFSALLTPRPRRKVLIYNASETRNGGSTLEATGWGRLRGASVSLGTLLLQ